MSSTRRAPCGRSPTSAPPPGFATGFGRTSMASNGPSTTTRQVAPRSPGPRSAGVQSDIAPTATSAAATRVDLLVACAPTARPTAGTVRSQTILRIPAGCHGGEATCPRAPRASQSLDSLIGHAIRRRRLDHRQRCGLTSGPRVRTASARLWLRVRLPTGNDARGQCHRMMALRPDRSATRAMSRRPPARRPWPRAGAVGCNHERALLPRWTPLAASLRLRTGARRAGAALDDPSHEARRRPLCVVAVTE